jgi:hypothetical protein
MQNCLTFFRSTLPIRDDATAMQPFTNSRTTANEFLLLTLDVHHGSNTKGLIGTGAVTSTKSFCAVKLKGTVECTSPPIIKSARCILQVTQLIWNHAR